jgi:hypothetical protein
MKTNAKILILASPTSHTRMYENDLSENGIFGRNNTEGRPGDRSVLDGVVFRVYFRFHLTV